jgi:uncharacterized delta-60 repeat protein
MKKLLLLALIAMAAFPLPAEARPGALDPSFGTGGKSIWSVPLDRGQYERLSAPGLAKLPSGGSVVLAGDFLFALRPDGRLERRFGGGRVEVAAPDGSPLRLADVAVDAGGRILVVGTDDERDDSFVARYTPDGKLDPSFAQGGVLRTDFGMAPPSLNRFPERPEPSPPLTRLNGIALDPDGRIVLSGTRVFHIGSCRGGINYLHREAFVVRLLEGGDVDSGLGQGGAVFVPRTPAVAPAALVPGSPGALYLMDGPVGGDCDFGYQRRITRLGSNGSPEGSFVVARPEFGASWDIAAMTVDRRGRILVAEHDEKGAVVRRLAGGGFDRSFGKKGAVRLDPLGTGGFIPSAIQVDQTGKIVVAGFNYPGFEEEPRKVLVGRLTAKGAVDRSFGSKGWSVTRFGRRSRVGPPDIALSKGGRVLLGAEITRPSLPGGEGIALARYLGR